MRGRHTAVPVADSWGGERWDGVLRAVPVQGSGRSESDGPVPGSGESGGGGVTRQDVRYYLGAWAVWKVTGRGYPPACSVGRLANTGRGSAPGSRIPIGVELSVAAALVAQAMDAGESAGYGEQILAVRAVYLRGAGQRVDDVADMLGVSVSTLRRDRLAGEDWIRRHLAIGCG